MLKSSACARHVIQAESAIFKIYCVKHAGISIRKALSSGDLHIENEYLRKGGSIRVYLQGKVQAGGKLQIMYACSGAAGMLYKINTEKLDDSIRFTRSCLS